MRPRIRKHTPLQERAWENLYNRPHSALPQLLGQKQCHIPSKINYKEAYHTRVAMYEVANGPPIQDQKSGLHTWYSFQKHHFWQLLTSSKKSIVQKSGLTGMICSWTKWSNISHTKPGIPSTFRSESLVLRSTSEKGKKRQYQFTLLHSYNKQNLPLQVPAVFSSSWDPSVVGRPNWIISRPCPLTGLFDITIVRPASHHYNIVK